MSSIDGKLITNISKTLVNTVRYSQNGTKILSGDSKGNIKIFNSNSTELVNHFKDSSTVNKAIFLENSKNNH